MDTKGIFSVIIFIILASIQYTLNQILIQLKNMKKYCWKIQRILTKEERGESTWKAAKKKECFIAEML